MLPAQDQNEQPTTTHVIYDKVTGRVLGRYREFHLEEEPAEGYVSDAGQVLEMFGQDEAMLARVTDGDINNLELMPVEADVTERVTQMLVSSKRNNLVHLPRLRLRTERDVLSGDGEDSITISIDVVNERNRIVRKYKGQVLVTTTRGKLSERGGRVEVQRGQAELTLTSVPETIDRVFVRVRAPDGSAMPDALELSFE
jgi:hypothetical protein